MCSGNKFWQVVADLAKPNPKLYVPSSTLLQKACQVTNKTNSTYNDYVKKKKALKIKRTKEKTGNINTGDMGLELGLERLNKKILFLVAKVNQYSLFLQFLILFGFLFGLISEHRQVVWTVRENLPVSTRSVKGKTRRWLKKYRLKGP